MSRLPLSRLRNSTQTVLFQLDECIGAFEALAEIDRLHKSLLDPSFNRSTLPFPAETVVSLVGMVRDCCCLYLRRLFDLDRRAHSLKQYYSGPEIDILGADALVQSCITAANKNVAHTDMDYTQWPSVDELVQSGIEERLKRIRLGLIFPQTSPTQS